MSSSGAETEILLDETVIIALRAIGTVLVIYSFGIVLTGVFRKIDQVGVNALSSLVASLFIPCFYISRLGKSFTLELITELWMVPLVYIGIVLLNAVITYSVILPFSRCKPSQRVWFALGQFFANVLALPLLVIPSLCSQIQFETTLLTNDLNGTKILTEAECVERGELFLILTTLVSQFLYWLLVFPFVFRFGTKPGKSHEEDHSAIELRRTVSAPPNCETTGNLEDSALLMDVERGIEDAHSRRGDDRSKVSDESPAASSRSSSAWKRRKAFIVDQWKSHEHIYKVLRTTLLKGAVFSQFVGVVIGLWPALSSALFDASGALQPIGAAVTATASGFAPVVNLALSATLGLQSREIKVKQLLRSTDELGVRRQTYTLFVFGRMVLLPVINFLAFYLVQDMVLPKDRLLRLAIYSTIATPAANLHIVVANILEDYTGARFLAKGSFFQFFTGIVSYTMFLFLGVVISAI